jgi:anti-sigma factor RsiW
MNCERARRLLARDADDPALARHLAACAECEQLAARWAELRRALRDRRTVVTPDAGFAARVTARLDRPVDPLVWAARRLLPATLALTLALGGWCLARTPAPASLAAELADSDLLSWVESGGEEGR